MLPAHEYRFADLQNRLDEHHQAPRRPPGGDRARRDRASRVDGLGDHRQAQVVTAVGSDPDFMQRSANGETLAHCVLLELHDRLRREGHNPARFYAVEP